MADLNDINFKVNMNGLGHGSGTTRRKAFLAAKKKVAKKMSWAESHGQKEGQQLKGTITGRKFGAKSYNK